MLLTSFRADTFAEWGFLSGTALPAAAPEESFPSPPRLPSLAAALGLCLIVLQLRHQFGFRGQWTASSPAKRPALPAPTGRGIPLYDDLPRTMSSLKDTQTTCTDRSPGASGVISLARCAVGPA